MPFWFLLVVGLIAIVAFELFLQLIQLVVVSVPGVPANLRVVQTRRDSMANILTYSISVAAPVDADVVSRELVVTVDGVSRDSVEFSGTSTDLGSIDVPEGASVQLSLVDMDDAGNASVPASVDFVAADTLAPGQPGAFTVSLVAERSESDNS
jgi:hypothetical protein